MSFRPCIVVPVFDHGSGMATLAAQLSSYDVAIYTVDDGSGEETQAILADVANRFSSVRPIRLAKNKGKGAAVMTGLRAARQDGFTHALQIDADGQHDVRDVSSFLNVASLNPDAVIAGVPIFDESAPSVRRIARYLTHVWVWIETLSFSIRDSMCGFRVYPLADTIAVLDRARIGRRMDFDTEILVRLFWRGTPILSVPTRVIYPLNGESHFRLWGDNVLISAMHVRLVFGMLWRAPMLIARRPNTSARVAPNSRKVAEQ
jgi:glycosyltransferase involved in cell wall biosynthesis